MSDRTCRGCRGSYVFGSDCEHCPKCVKELARISTVGTQKPTPDVLKQVLLPNVQNCTSKLRGLKDHEIQELVTAIRDSMLPVTQFECVRELISYTVTKYLESKGLRIDKR